jgi:hypothetical protein
MFFKILLFLPLLAWGEENLTMMAKDKEMNLSHEDQRLLKIGEVSTPEHIIGGLLGMYPGFGVGHAFQDRWTDRGYIFTIGEVGSLGILMLGVASCLGDAFSDSIDGKEESDCNNAFVVIGSVGFLGFKIWEVADVWFDPPGHNRKFRKLRHQINNHPPKKSEIQSLNLVPFLNRNMGSGINLQYRF